MGEVLDGVIPAEETLDDVSGPEEQVEDSYEESEHGDNPEESVTGLGLDYDQKIVHLVEKLCMPEKFVRERMVRVWKEFHEYWKTNQYIVWDESAQDFRSPAALAELEPGADIDPAIFAKQINIFRAHGEAIIAALANGVPFVKFFPEDADVIEDRQTAKGYTKLSKKIQQDNRAKLLLMKAIFTLFNEGLVFAYNEHRSDPDFGFDKIEDWAPVEHFNRQSFCPNCGFDLGVETDPVEPAVGQCPNCGFMGQFESEEIPETRSEFQGYKEVPKSREVVELYGPLHVQVPHNIRELKKTPYLRLDDEIHIELLRDIYPEFADKLTTGTSDVELYERQARANSDYFDEWESDQTTYTRIWLRPWTFNALAKEPLDDECVQKLKETYPDGGYFVISQGMLLEAVPDNLDQHWTATHHPLAMHLHADPIGKPLKPVQDITNELANLTLETIEFGIPETFADTDTLDFDQYNKSEARPGMVYPVKRRSGDPLAQSFHEIKTASLSQEVGVFSDKIEQMGQFVIGSFPSIWGGQIEGGSGTAREYELSRAQALQRLTITWEVIKHWWAELMAKAVRNYHKNMKGDVKFVSKTGTGFMNVWIRTAEMNGRVGEIEPEFNESFPISWAQRRDMVLNLIQLQNDDVGAVLTHPENSQMVSELLGFDELYIPGNDSRNKQLAEIAVLVQSEPMPSIDPMTGMPKLQSSIPIDPEIDNHQIEFETCVAWITSDVGQAYKASDPMAVENVKAHALEHKVILDQQMMQQAMMQAAQSEDGSEEGQSDNN